MHGLHEVEQEMLLVNMYIMREGPLPVPDMLTLNIQATAQLTCENRSLQGGHLGFNSIPQTLLMPVPGCSSQVPRLVS